MVLESSKVVYYSILQLSDPPGLVGAPESPTQGALRERSGGLGRNAEPSS